MAEKILDFQFTNENSLEITHHECTLYYNTGEKYVEVAQSNNSEIFIKEVGIVEPFDMICQVKTNHSGSKERYKLNLNVFYKNQETAVNYIIVKPN